MRGMTTSFEVHPLGRSTQSSDIGLKVSASTVLALIYSDLNKFREGIMSKFRMLPCITLMLAVAGYSGLATADDRAGTFKVVNGSVSVERDGQTLAAKVGGAVMQGDRVTTAPSSFAGITLRDNTRLTASPDSTLVIDAFSFDTTTHEGRLDASLKKGKLAVISGQLAKANPEAVTYNTGSMTIGVRGTEFILEAAGE